MKVFWTITEDLKEVEGSALAIGNFDGLHLGHRALIEKAKALRRPAGVLSFTPHPAELLVKDATHFYLTSREQKVRMLSRLGLDFLVFLRIDENFLQLSADNFVTKILVDALKVKDVVVGDDFTFGYKAQGSISLLEKLSLFHNFTLHVVPELKVNGVRVSSTAIKKFLQKGDMLLARQMLGRPYSFRGTVISGQKLGRRLGFKTANLKPPEGFLLKTGIYASCTKILQTGEKLKSVTSVGFRPTVTKEKRLLVETHCLDVERDLYGKEIEIFFIDRLRDELKFSSLNELQLQMQKDCQQVRQSYGHDPLLNRIED